LNDLLPFRETFMVSALKGDGLDRLLDMLAAAMPAGPYLFPEDDLSDLPQRMLAAEIVREQVLRQTHEEVPHQATVETEQWEERKDGSARIDVTIYVSRATQKAILIGDGGARVKEIGPPRAAGAGGAAGKAHPPVRQRQGTRRLGRGAQPAARHRP
jgi:GTP-binding protein Era